jgi:peroxiredoxin
MYPHERSLVERLKDKPFALIGINSDSRENAKAAVKRENITWRSFWDGGDTNGPIATAWNVRGWPTIYVLDHKGIIRYKNVRGPLMDQAVDDLLALLEKESAPTEKNRRRAVSVGVDFGKLSAEKIEPLGAG